MSHTRNLRFTDAVKDVIGNEPVLDQFDTFYAASFYGTMSDDYVTGTMLNETRGRAFSRLYSRSEAIPAPSVGMPDPNWGSNLSSYLQPLFEKTGNSYRNTSFYDETERIYDSCLINFNGAMSADDSYPKKISYSLNKFLNGTYSSSLSISSDSQDLTLSPIKSVDSNATFVTFNLPKHGIEKGYNDPSINNNWSWSYPYENRYNPQERFLNAEGALSVKATSKTLHGLPISANIGTDIDPIYVPTIDLFPFDKNSRFTAFFGSSNMEPPFVDTPSISLPMVTYASSIEPTGDFKKSIIPIIPGKLPQKMIPAGARNGNRIFDPYSLSSYLVPNYESSDNKFGFSFLMMNDIDLSSYPMAGSGLIHTSSAQSNDLIKFLFGFGDVNTLQNTDFTLNNNLLSSSYKKYWGRSSAGTYGEMLWLPRTVTWTPSFSSGDIEVNWTENSSSRGGNPDYMSKTWYIVTASSGPSGPPRRYTFDPASGAGSFTGGKVTWFANGTSQPDNSKILIGGDISGNQEKNILVCSVTASSAWNYTYTRAMHSLSSSCTLQSFVVKRGPGQIFDTVDGYANAYEYNQYYDSINPGLGHNPYYELLFDRYGIPSDDAISGSGLTSTQWGSGSYPGQQDYPFFEIDNPFDFNNNSTYTSKTYSPGIYFIGFVYDPGTSTSLEDFAIINYFAANVVTDNNFDINYSGPTMGGNNYPEFREIKFDDTPIDVGDGVDRTREYKSNLFGLSPIIRGWKYGLYSGLNSHSRATFRRDRFGQFRDMLEQRIYTKFINDSFTPFGDIATSGHKITQDPLESAVQSTRQQPGNLGPAPVSVSFVKQAYTRNERGIGKIYLVEVDPATTNSQNLSTEVTSSLPYFDGVARNV
jgi:hypothetical protein